MKKLLVNGKEDPDISEDSISILVEQRENKLWSATVIAIDELGKTYLGNVHLNDDIVVRFKYDDMPNDTWHTVFNGKVTELNPELSVEQGEICGIKAIQHPELKRMRVAEEYGIESRSYKQDALAINDDEEVDGWQLGINDWNHVNNSPWLHVGDSDKITHPATLESDIASLDGDYYINGWILHVNQWTHVNDTPWLNADDVSKVTMAADPLYLGLADGDFNFANVTLKTNSEITAWSLKLRAKLVNGVGGHATSATVTPSIWDGYVWHNLTPIIITSTDYSVFTINVLSILDIANFNNCRLYLTFSDVVGGGSTKGAIDISEAYFSLAGTTWNAGIIQPIDGNFTFQDFSCARETMSITELTLNLRCRLADGAGGHATNATIKCEIHDGYSWLDAGTQIVNSTNWMTLTYDVLHILDIVNFNDVKLRIILTAVQDGGATKGTIEISWVYFHIEGTGYNSVGTLREIMTNPDIGIIPNFTEKILGGIPSGYSLGTDYIWNCASEFKYITFPYEPCLNALNDLISLLSAMDKPCHWIILPDHRLCVAPLGNHIATGKAGHIINDIWKTYGRIIPIAVKKSMITTEFSQKEVEANYVIITGIFEHPMGEIWTEGNAKNWEVYSYSGAGIIPSISDDAVYVKVGTYSNKLHLYNPSLPSGMICGYRMACPVDFTKIQTKNTIPTIDFWFRKGGWTWGHELCFFKDWTNYFHVDFSAQLVENQWVKISISLDIKDWGQTGTLTWADVAYIGFRMADNGVGMHEVDSWVDELFIHGTVTRAAYCSTDIKPVSEDGRGNGCKMKLITDSLAQCDSLNADDGSSPLALFAYAELKRGMSSPLIGEIKIPMDARLVAGQLVYIKMSPRNANFPHDCPEFNGREVEDYLTMRILEHRISYSILGPFSYLTLSSDLTNSIALSPNDMYSAILKASNPDFQDRDRGSMKGGNIDIEQTVLAKDYP